MIDTILFGAYFGTGFLLAPGIIISVLTFIKWPFDLKKELKGYRENLALCYKTCNQLRKEAKEVNSEG